MMLGNHAGEAEIELTETVGSATGSRPKSGFLSGFDLKNPQNREENRFLDFFLISTVIER